MSVLDSQTSHGLLNHLVSASLQPEKAELTVFWPTIPSIHTGLRPFLESLAAVHLFLYLEVAPGKKILGSNSFNSNTNASAAGSAAGAAAATAAASAAASAACI